MTRDGLGSELAEAIGAELGQNVLALLREYIPLLEAQIRRGLPVLSDRLAALNVEKIEVRAVLAFAELQTFEAAIANAHIDLCKYVQEICSTLWASDPDMPQQIRNHATKLLKEQLVLELSYAKYDVLRDGFELCRSASFAWGNTMLRQGASQ